MMPDLDEFFDKLWTLDYRLKLLEKSLRGGTTMADDQGRDPDGKFASGGGSGGGSSPKISKKMKDYKSDVSNELLKMGYSSDKIESMMHEDALVDGLKIGANAWTIAKTLQNRSKGNS